MLITLKEYADKYGKSKDMVYAKYKAGLFKTARKYGNIILIEENEPLPYYREQPGDRFDALTVVRLREHKNKNRG